MPAFLRLICIGLYLFFEIVLLHYRRLLFVKPDDFLQTLVVEEDFLMVAPALVGSPRPHQLRHIQEHLPRLPHQLSLHLRHILTDKLDVRPLLLTRPLSLTLQSLLLLPALPHLQLPEGRPVLVSQLNNPHFSSVGHPQLEGLVPGCETRRGLSCAYQETHDQSSN